MTWIRILRPGFVQGMFMLQWFTVPFLWVFVLQHHDFLVKGPASFEWPETSGVIRTSGVSSSNEPFLRRQDMQERTTSTLHFSYSYRVEGREYASSQPKFGFILDGGTEILKRYPPGEVVRVFYNPSDPAEAVLERGATTSTWIIISAGFAYLAILVLAPPAFVVVRLLDWRRRRRLSAAINPILRRHGFRLMGFGGDIHSFGDKESRLKIDDSAFHLTEPERAFYNRHGHYKQIWPPIGVAVLDWKGRLVELFNGGARDGYRKELLHLVVETPWTCFHQKSGYHSNQRNLSLWGRSEKTARELNCLLLSMRDDTATARRGEWRLKELEWVFSNLPEERKAIEPFDTGDESFDSFFRLRRAGILAREALKNAAEPGRAVESLARWRDKIHGLRVSDRIDLWIDAEKLPDWVGFAESLPELLSDVASFARKLESMLLAAGRKN